MQLVDTTVFFSPTSGGVKRYLTAKHAWLTAHGAHRHSILVPGRHTCLRPGGISTIAGIAAAIHFQLPTAAVGAHLDAHAGCARARPDRSRRRVSSGLVRGSRRARAQHPAGRVLPFASGAGARRGASARASSAPSRATCARCTRSSIWCWRRAARCAATWPGSASRAARYQPLGVDTEIFSPARRTLDLRRHAGAAGRCAPAGVRGPLFRGKEPARAARGDRAAGQALPPAADRRRPQPRAERQCDLAAVPARQHRAGAMAGLGRRAGARRQQRNLRTGDRRSHGVRPAGGRRARRRGA